MTVLLLGFVAGLLVRIALTLTDIRDELREIRDSFAPTVNVHYDSGAQK